MAGFYAGGFFGSAVAPTCELSTKIHIGRAGKLVAKVRFLEEKAIPYYHQHCQITEENLCKIRSTFQKVLNDFYDKRVGGTSWRQGDVNECANRC